MDDIQMANKHMRRCSTSFFIREMQIKTAVRYYFIPTRIARLKTKQTKKRKISIGKDVEKLELLCTAGRNVKWCSH